MKTLFGIIVWLGLLCGAAFAQQNVTVNYQTTGGPIQVSTANPLPVTGSAGATAQPVVQVGVATLATGQASVGSSSTLIVAARTGNSGTGRKSVTIVNNSTTPVYIGVSGVTTSTGVYLPGVAGASLTLDTQAAVYGVISTGSETVSYVETY